MAVEEPRFGAAAGGRGRAQAGEDADHRAVNRLQQKTEAGWTLNSVSSSSQTGSRRAAAWTPVFFATESVHIVAKARREDLILS